MDRLLDTAVTGPLYLRQPKLAAMVVEAIRYRDAGHYHLHNFVVTANHVHMPIPPQVPVYRAGRQSNTALNRTIILAGREL